MALRPEKSIVSSRRSILSNKKPFVKALIEQERLASKGKEHESFQDGVIAKKMR